MPALFSRWFSSHPLVLTFLALFVRAIKNGLSHLRCVCTGLMYFFLCLFFLFWLADFLHIVHVSIILSQLRKCRLSYFLSLPSLKCLLVKVNEVSPFAHEIVAKELHFGKLSEVFILQTCVHFQENEGMIFDIPRSIICFNFPFKISGNAAAPCTLRRRQYQLSRLLVLTSRSAKPSSE